MGALKNFNLPAPRPLPVILLADVSGSMEEDGKIDALNAAVSEMISSFAEEASDQVQIQVAVITFGHDGPKLHQPLEASSKIVWQPLQAWGETPMGQAFRLARSLIEDRNLIPSRAFAPSLILVSDGIPTDEWEAPLSELVNSERAEKTTRYAMAIGADAGYAMLLQYVGLEPKHLFAAHEARGIRKFFRWVTMTTITRTISPDQPVDFPLLDDF